MAEDFLSCHPDLRHFVLTDVQLTGTNIGDGAYGKVDEVTFPVAAAAKTIHAVLFKDLSKPASEFVSECQLMSTLHHPNIVRFLGLAFFPGSRLPALVMERLLTSLHDLLNPDTPLPRDAVPPLAFFSMALKCSVLQDVARGMAYLHMRSPPIIHRDLSARNVLLNSGMVAKVADLGVARIAPSMKDTVTMTKGPGAFIYMPPEAFAADKSKYDASIDIFSLGIVAIFTISETLPYNPLEPTYVDEQSGLLVARTELQRRSEYMRIVNEKLDECGQLHADQPFIRLIQQCLQNLPAKRPAIHEVQHLLEEARACFEDGDSERNRHDLVQALQTQPRSQNLECVLRDLVTENADLKSKIQEVRSRMKRELPDGQHKLTEMEEHVAKNTDSHSRLQQQLREKERELQLSEREKEIIQQQLSRAEETIRREQQQIQDMIQRETELVQAKERELTEALQQLRQKEEQLRSSEALVADLKFQHTKQSDSVSGSGLTSATVNNPTPVIVELADSSGTQNPQTLNLSAQLELIAKATPTRSLLSLFKKQQKPASVTMVSPSRYIVTYTAVSRGQHKFHVQVNEKRINGSPFTVTVYLDPTQLNRPVRVTAELDRPYGIAYNNREEMVVTEFGGNKVSIFELRGQGKIRTFGSEGDRPHEMIQPAGIAVDDADNIYVSSWHKLQKFTSSGELIKCTGERGKKEGEFDDPLGLTLYDNEVYVCDSNNHRIQVFDLDLNFVRFIGARGGGRGDFNSPQDAKFDTDGNMYVADGGNGRVQVMERSGKFIREFGEGELKRPSGLHITDKYIYVSDYSGHCIVVYETSGKFVTSFGKRGQNEGEFFFPRCITTFVDGYIHVCDWGNDRVQIF